MAVHAIRVPDTLRGMTGVDQGLAMGDIPLTVTAPGRVRWPSSTGW